MVSISDVARAAGVSATTVSHAISGKRHVSESLRARVESAMHELNYVPTRAARSLALGRADVVALVVPDIGIEYFAELAKNVERVAVERGYGLMLATTSFDLERESRYVEMIASRAVDGIIYASGADLGERARELLRSAVPVVLVDEQLPGLSLRTVVSDNETGGALVAEHLAALGHRSVLEIQGVRQPVTSVDRSRGFASAWPSDGTIETTTGDYTAAAGAEAVRRSAEAFTEHRLTAVFAHNDMMALGAIQALNELGLRVPLDVSVTGFDDVSAAHFSAPNLTTVRQEPAVLGRLAAEALLDALDGGAPLATEHTLVPVELVVRESTAKVAS